MTALWVASEAGHIAVCDYLLSHGADSGYKSHETAGFTCLHRACANKHWAVVLRLLRAGADAYATSKVSAHSQFFYARRFVTM